jgi:hypothetical protein
LLSYKVAKIVIDFEFDIAIDIAIDIVIVFVDDHHSLPILLIEKALNFQLLVNR